MTEDEAYRMLDFEQAKAAVILPTTSPEQKLAAAIEKQRIADEAKVAEGFDDDDEEEVEEAPWFCIRTEIWVCPNPECDIYSNFVTGDHLIIVWPEKDDIQMLRIAARCKNGGRNPRIVEYEERFGACMSYFEWEARGKPVHGEWSA